MLEMNTLYNMDCMIGMKEFPDGFFDLAVVDPPYGDVTGGGYTVRKYDSISHHIGNGSADQLAYNKEVFYQSKPSPDYFKELFRVSKNQIIWVEISL